MNVQPTPHFFRQLKRLVKKYPSLRSEIESLKERLENDPVQGIYLGKNCYKIRLGIASKGRGKSGGGRVVTCVQIVEDTVYLLAIFDKSAQENMTDFELDDLLMELGLLPEKD